MKASDVVGRKIVRVLQTRTPGRGGEILFDVEGFVLDNGRVISFLVRELEDAYAITATVLPRTVGTPDPDEDDTL